MSSVLLHIHSGVCMDSGYVQTFKEPECYDDVLLPPARSRRLLATYVALKAPAPLPSLAAAASSAANCVIVCGQGVYARMAVMWLTRP